MAKTTLWLNAILDYNYEEGEVDHINGVRPVFPFKYNYLTLIGQ